MIKDMTGQKFGRLTVMKYAYSDKYRCAVWTCKCDCGNYVNVKGTELRYGRIKSCGCLQKDMARKANTKHGKSNTKLHQVWRGIKDRCYNANAKNYKYYGGRGITICDEWLHDFEAFYDWSMKNGYKEGLTIDRINVKYDYCPDNCRWTTMKQQNRNSRHNRNITINGVTHCMKDWCNILGLKYSTVSNRINVYNWSIERALELEV